MNTPTNPAPVNPKFPEASTPKMAINEFINLVLDMIEDGDPSDPKTRQLFQACQRMEGNYRTAGDISAAGLMERMDAMAEENEELAEPLDEDEQKELQEEQAERAAEAAKQREMKQLDEMSLSQLKQYARENEIDLGDAKSREEITDKIKEELEKEDEESDEGEGEDEQEAATDEQLNAMTVDQLKQYAENHEIELGEATSKEDIVSKIKEDRDSEDC